MRILLTGATGFLGRFVLEALDIGGYEVVAVSRHDHENSGKKIRWVQGNLLNEDDCRRIVGQARADVLIHFAWYAEHGKFWNAAENFDWTRATVLLFQEFARNGGKRAVFAGSCAEYDWQEGYCSEEITSKNPSSVYGQCKDATNRLTKSLAHLAGVEWVWGRIFFPFGFGEHMNRLLPYVINSLLRQAPVICSHGGQFRDYLPAEDVASAFVHLACKTDVCGDFNVSSGIPTRISELVDFCVQLIEPSAKPDFGGINILNTDPPFLVGDNRKLKSSGWQPQTDLKVALTSMIKRYRALER